MLFPITLILVLHVLGDYNVLSERFKILAIFPYWGKSHWWVFEPLVEELAKRGHDVTVVSHHPRETPLENYRDISLRGPHSVSVHTKDMNSIGSKSRLTETNVLFSEGVERLCREGLNHPNIRKLIKSNETYDLLITEIFNADCYLGFVHKFNAPFIGIRTSPLSPWSNERIGNPDNPSYIPNSFLGMHTRMNFCERLENFIVIIFHKWLYESFNQEGTKLARQHFGNDMPSLDEIARKTSVILVNTHFVHQYAKPLVPGVKEIGGIHIKPKKPLPKDIEDWISGSEDGVIYFSLGSMLKSSSVSDSTRKAILEAFAELPHRVIMKWENQTIIDLPPNVRTLKWAPQYDILCHPNTKLFISHAGMLSTIEAVYSGTPMIAIPAYGDQPTNAALLQERGFALVIQYTDITKEILLTAMKKILYQPSYAARAKEMSLAIRDRLVSPLQEATYWTEYAARHRGAPLLRSSALELPLYKYILLDVIGALLLTILICFWLIWFILRFIFRKLYKKKVNKCINSKRKKKKNN